MSQSRGAALLVESRRTRGNATKELLRELGYTVIRAETAVAALDAVSSATYDLVVADATLPGHLNGFELGAILQFRWADLAVVMMMDPMDELTHEAAHFVIVTRRRYHSFKSIDSPSVNIH